jgi:glutamine synthetase
VTTKYILFNFAEKNGLHITLMPKPMYQQAGNGLHLHLYLTKNGKNIFYKKGAYANMSDIGKYFIGGLLKHGPAVSAFTNPSTNSYKRLVPGFEAPVNLAYSQRNRSAAVRIPMYSTSPKSKRVEFRCPDPSANPYLAFSAMLMAGLDGIINRINPGEPLDKDIYDMPPEELKNVPSTPGSLNEAIKALANDHEYLLKGDVFTEDVIETWIKYKIEKEIKPMALQPHPFEFGMYYDV